MNDKVLLASGMIFCSLECLCTFYTNYPEKFYEDEVEVREPEGQPHSCFECGKERGF